MSIKFCLTLFFNEIWFIKLLSAYSQQNYIHNPLNQHSDKSIICQKICVFSYNSAHNLVFWMPSFWCIEIIRKDCELLFHASVEQALN